MFLFKPEKLIFPALIFCSKNSGLSSRWIFLMSGRLIILFTIVFVIIFGTSIFLVIILGVFAFSFHTESFPRVLFFHETLIFEQIIHWILPLSLVQKEFFQQFLLSFLQKE